MLTDWRGTLKLIGLRKPNPKVSRAMDYLISRGQRFCVDFGIDNAVVLARDDWRKRRQRKRQQRTK